MEKKVIIIMILAMGFLNILKSQIVDPAATAAQNIGYVTTNTQVNTADSLALLDILNENCNSCPLTWNTSLPISTWEHVVLSANSTKVEELRLNNMNLSGKLSSKFSNLNALKFLDISNNPITMEANSFQGLAGLEVLKLNNCNLKNLPDLTNCNNLNSLECHNNHLSFDDLEPIFIDNSSLEAASDYSPQHTRIPNRPINKVYTGSPIKINLEFRDESPNNVYSWRQNYTAIGSTTVPSFEISSINASHAGEYHVSIENAKVPDLKIVLGANEIGQKHIEVALQSLSVPPSDASDAMDGAHHRNELIVKFKENTPVGVKNSIIKSHGGTRVDACICDIELWYWDSLILDIENKKEQIASEPDIESVDFNYVINSAGLSRNNQDTTILPVDRLLEEKMQFSKETLNHTVLNPFDTNPTKINPALVAIIDAGIDHDHDDFRNIFWTNDEELGDGSDSDGNCIENDTLGYDFIDEDAAPMDTTWYHGTHVAGLVQKYSDDNARIMSIRVFGNQTKSSLFAAVCATYYAAQKDAKVINMSWGWYGEPSEVLKNAIVYAGKECGALVVCSAGNDSRNIDDYPHYPSGYDLENILVVASVYKYNDSKNYQTTKYSNWGEGVDIATLGALESTIPNNQYATLEGTSMSAAVISGVAAYLFAHRPEATWKVVKDCILATSKAPASTQGCGRFFDPSEYQKSALEDIANRAVPSACPSVFPPVSISSTVSAYISENNYTKDLVMPVSDSFAKTNETKTASMELVSLEGEVRIGISPEASCEATVRIYNASMKEIYQEKLKLEKGSQKIIWKGNDAPPGKYSCRIEAGREIFVGEMVK